MNRRVEISTWELVLLAGLAGGTAEVLWVILYSSVSGVSAGLVARQVTASLWPAAAEWAVAPVLGVAIHMALAVALAALCAPLLLSLFKNAAPVAVTLAAVIALSVVWAVNFFIVLPVLNPAFIELMPYGATLASKILFGLAMAAVVRRSRLTKAPNRNR